ncbi:uncharacterized protein LOC122959892 [Acropora millepora]|uniref:uncharacterized protein LOC122959892 n=1 Tax=Acropora millepora TaxID=45264 RepID=UPI001CF42399|nr:uncharacterized protein LOC122959892 [Acropora millepora]
MFSFMDESRSSQRKRARSQDSSAIYSPIPCKRPLFVSTSIATSTVVTRSKGKDSVSGRSFEVDKTGSTARHSSSPGASLGNSLAQHTTSLERAVSLNPSFASLKGNPMGTMEDSEAESICSSVEGSCDSEACDMSSEYDTEDELMKWDRLIVDEPAQLLIMSRRKSGL